jgi:hypothetical protein
VAGIASPLSLGWSAAADQRPDQAPSDRPTDDYSGVVHDPLLNQEERARLMAKILEAGVATTRLDVACEIVVRREGDVSDAYSLGDGRLARRAQKNTEKNLTDALGRLDRVMIAAAKQHDLPT